MLAKQVVAGYGDRVRIVDENFGASPLAERYGLKYYPAVFVGEGLVARPQDFWAFEAKEGETPLGRYIPWKNADNHAKFKADLKRMIDLTLAGHKLPDEVYRPQPELAWPVARLPDLMLRDIAGKELKTGSSPGKVTVVMFWATWCPPCKQTLQWLEPWYRGRDAGVEVLTVAVSSEEAAVRKMVKQWALSLPVVMETSPVTEAFGNIAAVPTLFIFAPDGRTARVFYGAPDDLHDKVQAVIRALLHQDP